MHAECEHQFSVLCCKPVCYGLLLFVLRFLREGPRTYFVYNVLIFIRIERWYVRTQRLGTREICVSSTKMGYFVDTILETAMPSTFSLHIVDGAGCEWMGPGVYGERGQSRESGLESPGVYGERGQSRKSGLE